jgi:hypothetical protein
VIVSASVVVRGVCERRTLPRVTGSTGSTVAAVAPPRDQHEFSRTQARSRGCASW